MDSKTDAEFDVDSVLNVLGQVAEKLGEASVEGRSLRIAAVALVFVQQTNQLDRYRTFFERFHSPASEVVRISRSFASRDLAMEWLRGSEAAEYELVQIEGVTHVVVKGPDGFMFVRTRSPQELEEEAKKK